MVFDVEAFDADVPRGWLATYDVDDDTIDVVFLILDLGRDRMRQAATTSVTKKPRSSAPPKSGGGGSTRP